MKSNYANKISLKKNNTTLKKDTECGIQEVFKKKNLYPRLLVLKSLKVSPKWSSVIIQLVIVTGVTWPPVLEFKMKTI